VKYAWIAAQDKSFSLTEMCDVLNVSISGYRAWKCGGKPDRKRLPESQMLALIRLIHAELKGAYGSPRRVRELRASDFSASKGGVQRLMRDNGICARHKRRYKVTTDSKHGLPVAGNLLARNFTPSTPNQVWTSDIVTDALTIAWFRKRPAAGLLHHSDRGSQYASHTFQERLSAHGMICSMSRKGNCWDNAPTENWIREQHQERLVA
jgi:putative transposase